MISKRDEYFLDSARSLARSSSERNQHGCLIVNHGNVVGVGFNKFRNDPSSVSPEHIKTDCSYHAEMVALGNAGVQAQGAVLYVARINRQGFDRNSRPCYYCNKAIKVAGIKRVVYTVTGEYNVGA